MRRLLALIAIAACSDASTKVPPVVLAPIPIVASTQVPDTDRAAARQALAFDAAAREARFLDAVDPGRTFRATRLEQADIDADAVSTEYLFGVGALLFRHRFTPELGFGGAHLPPLSRVHLGRRGGPDSRTCTTCHWRGGPAGAGDAADHAYQDGDGDTPTSAFERNPPALVGAGWVELLAAEMTRDLQVLRDSALATARARGAPVTMKLTTRGVDFGKLTARPDGTVDSGAIAGVDADLVVKPFGRKGSFRALRDAVEDALLIHHGMQSEWLVRTAGPERVGAAGGADPDGDGVEREVTEGQVTALTAFVALQDTPIETQPEAPELAPVALEGRTHFRELGCASCHVPSLPVSTSELPLPSRLSASVVTLDLARDATPPRPWHPEGERRLWLYSDLRRHDLGSELADARADRGVAPALFLTPPLWGLAVSGPYLHDGRAHSLDDAVRAHGGEAAPARDAWLALAEDRRASVRVFLTTLTRARRWIVP
ncbi:MAG: hypothetical protein IV100_35060 [Myxococcales bacterium]|nr:hypothetical protein [Myxococcales bacterium]